MVGFSFTHEEVMDRWGRSDRDRQRLELMYDAWASWPNIRQANAIWEAASRITGNENDVEIQVGDRRMLDLDVLEEDVELVESFADHHQEMYEEQGMGTVRLHRFFADPPEEVREFDPKVVGSWAGNPAAIVQFEREILGVGEGSVVTHEVNINSTLASYRTLDVFEPGQTEYVVMMGEGAKYGSFKVRKFSEFVEEEGL